MPGVVYAWARPERKGWYVLNMGEAEWRHADGRGAVCAVADDFEGRRRDGAQFGVNPFVLEPGEPMSMYHWEADQPKPPTASRRRRPQAPSSRRPRR
jgi:hypothetical protein